MFRSRAVRLSLAGILGLFVLFALWAGWQAWQVNRDLKAAVGHAEAIQRAVEARDSAALERQLDALRTSSSAAADRTSGFTWAVLTKVPFFGDDAEGIEVTSQVLDDLARDGIAPLVDVSDRVDELLPKDGAVDLQVVHDLAGPVASAEAAFAAAEERLATQDPSGFIDTFKQQFRTFQDRVVSASDALGSARIATAVLPTMLGEDSPQTYLLGFENNAELRSTGGLLGAASYLRADNGKLTLQSHVTGGSYGRTPEPILPPTAAEEALYEETLGSYFVNAGMTPDVPRAAELMRAHSEDRYPRRDLAGVLLVDTVSMGYLIDATGPITVDGVKVSGDNLVDELLHATYLRLEPAAQDAFFADVAEAAFDRFTNGAGSPVALMKALGKASGENRIFVHSFVDDVQERFAGTAIAGEFVTDPEVEEPQITITLNDTTGSKMSYFLRQDVDINATSCVDGVQSFSAKMRLRSDAPAEAVDFPASVTGGGNYGVPPGQQVVTVRVFGPVGGSIGGFRLNGTPGDLIRVDQDGRPVGMTYIELGPGQTLDLAWTMKSGPGQTGAAELAVTPTVEQNDNVVTVGSACR